MDRLERMRLFVRVVERGSFSAAAADYAIGRSTATTAIKALEENLGVRLLERTTRHVTTTLDGKSFYDRCLFILGEVDEAENAFRDTEPRGLLRVDAHQMLTRTFLLPGLAGFLDRYPLLNLQLGQGDRLVDLVREGVDCVIRGGAPSDSTLIMRRLTKIEQVTAASPAYLARHGTPVRPEALVGHSAVGFLSSRNNLVLPLEFTVDGNVKEVPLHSRVTVNNSDTAAELARLGFGLIQAPRYRLKPDLERGALVEILSEFPPPGIPVSAFYPQNRHATPRLRVFLDWVAARFSEERPTD